MTTVRFTIGICRTFWIGNYRHLPDGLSAFAGHFSDCLSWLIGFCQRRSADGCGPLQSLLQILHSETKPTAVCGLPACRNDAGRTGAQTRRPEPSREEFHAGMEGTGSGRGAARETDGKKSRGGRAARTPPERRHRRPSGESPANGVRPLLSQRTATPADAMMAHASTAVAATPAQSTRSPAVADLLGARAGVAAHSGPRRGARTMRPAPSRPRSGPMPSAETPASGVVGRDARRRPARSDRFGQRTIVPPCEIGRGHARGASVLERRVGGREIR